MLWLSSGNISYSDDDSSTEYSSDSDDMNIRSTRRQKIRKP